MMDEKVFDAVTAMDHRRATFKTPSCHRVRLGLRNLPY